MSDEDRKALTYVELDYDFCRLRYGETTGDGTCNAALGSTGEAKCFNTRATCQDPENYAPETKVLRFVKPAGFEPKSIDAIPSVNRVDTAPARLRPGEDLGERASVSVDFKDHPYHDRTVDKYASERVSGAAQNSGEGYDPAAHGTYWGKWRSRNPYFQNRGLRIIQGSRDQSTLEGNDYGLGRVQSMDRLFLGDTNEAIYDFYMRPGGESAFVAVEDGGTVRIGELEFSEPYNILSVSDNQNTLGVSFARGITFKPDGTKVFVSVGGSVQQLVREYSLGTAWDLTTETLNTSYDVSGETERPTSVAFNDDGTKMFVSESTPGRIIEYDLGTAWDIDTASPSGAESRELTPSYCWTAFGDGGRVLAVVYNAPDFDQRRFVDVYSLSTPYDLGSLALRNTHAFSGSQIVANTGVGFSPDGRYMYITAGEPTTGGVVFIGSIEQFDVTSTFPDMEVRHYVMESIDGPTSDGRFTITAKDVLKLADDDRAQAPRASEGTLDADITASDTSATLSPAGIGNEYPDSGFATIGNEVVSYTRTGDNLTLNRGQYGTAASEHGEGDTVQVAIEYDSERASDIVTDLLVTYANVPPDFIPIAEWRNEDDTFINRLYTALIVEPTGVRELIDQLSLQVGFTNWWDEIAQFIRFRAIRQPNTPPRLLTDEADFRADSPSVKEQQKKRISQVWVYYGVIDPTEDLQEARNYRSVYVGIDADAESENQYQKPKIKKIYGRWIDRFNRPAAEDLAKRVLSRYRDAPRKFMFDIPRRDENLSLGLAYDVQSRLMQQPDGDPANTRILVTSYEAGTERTRVESEEFLYTPPDDDGVKRVIVDADTLQQADGSPFNLREAFDNIYTGVDGSDTVELIISGGVVLGSNTTDTPACDIGDWPAGTTVRVIVSGRIQGRGGDGSYLAGDGFDGGPALYTRRAIELDNSGGIWGGGGGGAGAQGGGGAGYAPGQGSEGATDVGNDGTRTSGGGVDDLAYGGDPGQPGEDSDSGVGGAAGVAIDGASHVTFTTQGDIRGPQVN